MKSYPSIPYWKAGHFGEPVYVFEKLDGTQIRAVWTKKRGWDKFGSKGQLIDDSSEWANMIEVFMEAHGDELPRLFKSEYPRIQEFTIFGEYWGYHSFIGTHFKPERRHVTIFDVSLYKQGFVLPREFSKVFTGDPYRFARCFGRFTYGKALVDAIFEWEPLDSILNEVNGPSLQGLFEGVVCKGTRKTKGRDLIWQAKCKTEAWLKAVRALKGDKYLLEEVNGDKELAAL